MNAVPLVLFALLSAPLSAQDPPPVQTPTPVATPSPSPTPAISFDEWLAGLRAEAIGKGIAEATLDRAFAGLQPDPVIIARDRMQPEQTQSLDDYVKARMTRKRLEDARFHAIEQRALVQKIQKTYGIPGPLMIAIWALESNFGSFTGVRPVITALATLAYDSRRPALFRAELFQALTILDKGLVDPQKFIGSWAGAIGQPQFMPSSFLKHAVDFDADGTIDIWSSAPDVLGSMANYLKNAGWTEGERWGREVSITQSVLDKIERAVPQRATGCRARREMTEPRPLEEWRKLGVKALRNARLPVVAGMQASLVRGRDRHFLVYRNYEAILDYNCSNAYGISVGLLADEIAAK
jgi:membrane-bound lytic murein transglycosylase B